MVNNELWVPNFWEQSKYPLPSHSQHRLAQSVYMWILRKVKASRLSSIDCTVCILGLPVAEVLPRNYWVIENRKRVCWTPQIISPSIFFLLGRKFAPKTICPQLKITGRFDDHAHRPIHIEISAHVAHSPNVGQTNRSAPNWKIATGRKIKASPYWTTSQNYKLRPSSWERRNKTRKSHRSYWHFLDRILINVCSKIILSLMRFWTGRKMDRSR
jgi:hypothetical protein